MKFDANTGGFKMVEKIPDLPENVVGVTAKGTVTAQDYEAVIIPAVEASFSHRDKARFLYHLGDDFKGFEASALWDDTKVGLKHFASWEKMAVVSDVQWVRWAVKIFGLVMPGQFRVFNNRELTEAKRWISE